MSETVRESMFKNKKPNFDKLQGYGFQKQGEFWVYTIKIMEDQMELTISVSSDGAVDTKVVDLETYDEYTLYRVPNASGSFVGKVKSECEENLRLISELCFEWDVFKSGQAKEIINYVKDTYGDELEFLWKKTPKNAVLRRKDNQKWYAALLTVSWSKLNVDSDEEIEILDLRMTSAEIEKLVDGRRYYPGYHMNKKSWVTICLDDSVSTQEILNRIDASYEIAGKKS